MPPLDIVSQALAAARGTPPPGATPAAPFGRAPMIGNTQRVNMFGDDRALLKFFDQCKQEAFADRWIFERQWTRAIHYLQNRQWLAPYSRTDGWRDARIPKGVPRPCTSKPREIDQSIRAMFAAIRFGVIIRPTSQSPQSIAMAAACDDLAPMFHDMHRMDTVMNEFDYWLINLGNGLLHTYWDESAQYGILEIPFERCAACGLELRSDEIAKTNQRCPKCGGSSFTIVLDPNTGDPKVDIQGKGAACTVALSPLEYAFPFTYPRWTDVPFVIRMRWRDKRDAEEHPGLQQYLTRVQWQRGASERSMQIFQSLPLQNDLPAPRNGWMEAKGTGESEGIPEYELWVRPTAAHPDGLVMRVWGDNNPVVIRLEDREGLPGPIPYRTRKGNPLFSFTHAAYNHVGGRVIGSGVHDAVFQKYDQVNRIDSLVEMILMRTAAPQWMLPKGAEVEWLGNAPGLPGLLLQWNAQIAGQGGRPELVQGRGVDGSIITWRKQLLEDIEEATGTYDILRGSKPAGVEAFSAMQLLVESGQRRFSSCFQSRGLAYRDWFTYAVEIERQFGPTDRILAVLSPTKTWQFQRFMKATLQGDVEIIIEDGTYTPKTSLGERAAIEHLNTLGYLDPTDPEQKMVVLTKFGQQSLAPGLNTHQQAALRKHETFERWILDGGFMKMAPGTDISLDTTYPLRWQPWFSPQVHRTEFLKWTNGDRIQALIAKYPPVEGLLRAHLMEIDLAIMQQQSGSLDPLGLPGIQAPPGGPGAPGDPAAAGASGGAPPSSTSPPGGGGPPSAPGGAGMAMRNANTNAGGVQTMPGAPQGGGTTVQ
jgi:hypothetical protein